MTGSVLLVSRKLVLSSIDCELAGLRAEGEIWQTTFRLRRLVVVVVELRLSLTATTQRRCHTRPPALQLQLSHPHLRAHPVNATIALKVDRSCHHVCSCGHLRCDSQATHSPCLSPLSTLTQSLPSPPSVFPTAMTTTASTRRSHLSCLLPSLPFSLALLPLLLLLSLLPTPSLTSPPLHLTIERYTLYINHTAFFVQGVCYNPASLGTAPAWTPPWGDYLQPQYQDVWERDFPVMRAMGVNTVRVWQWNNDVDHGLFLDVAHRHGLKVLVNFYIGSGQFPVQLDWQRQQLLGAFKWQVQRYLHHPALLAWVFGAEINAPWNNFLPAFSNAFGCGWNGAIAPAGCFGDPLTAKESGCHQSIACVYQHMLEFVNTAAIYAKDAMGGKPSHLVLGGLADVDVVTSRLGLYEKFAPQVDGWAMQIYRGRDFGTGDNDFLQLYEKHSVKPLVVTEYGVDAYNDPCGESETSPCYNFAHEPPAGYGEDEETQAEWVSTTVTPPTLCSVTH